MKLKEVREEVRGATARFAAEVTARFPDVEISTRFAPTPHTDSGVTALCSSNRERERVMNMTRRLALKYFKKEGVFIEGWAYLPGEYAWPHYFPTEEEEEMIVRLREEGVREEVRGATARFAAEVTARFPDVEINTRFAPTPHTDSWVTALCSSNKERERVMNMTRRLALRYFKKEGVFIEGWAYLPGEYPWPHHFPEEEDSE